MSRVDGKVIIVTGASSGIGRAEAEMLVSRGARVALTDINEKDGRRAAQVLGDNAAFLRHDVSDETAWQEVVAKTVETFGRVDGLINNAGIYLPTNIDETTTELFDKQAFVNQRGTFLGVKTVSAHMKSAGHGGSIINTSSICGIKGLPGCIAYTSTKWAIRGMTQSAAAELGQHNIRVNTILPGFIDTPILKANSDEMNAAGATDAVLGRLGKPEEIALLAVYLLSEDSAFVTGSEFLIDGGWSL